MQANGTQDDADVSHGQLRLARLQNGSAHLVELTIAGTDPEKGPSSLTLVISAAEFARSALESVRAELGELWINPAIEGIRERSVSLSHEPATIGDLLALEELGFAGPTRELLAAYHKITSWRLNCSQEVTTELEVLLGLNPLAASVFAQQAAPKTEPAAPAPQTENERAAPVPDLAVVASSPLAPDDMDAAAGGGEQRSLGLSPVLRRSGG